MAKALFLSLLLLTSCDASAVPPLAARSDEAKPCTFEDRRPATGAMAALPQLRGRVTDEANILSDRSEARLTGKLTELEERTSDQLVVVTVASLAGESINSFGLRLGKCWGIGRAELDNGVLLIVAPNDRKVRIEVGVGLEGLLTDERAAAIIEDTLLPRLRQGDYDAATEAGVADISTLLLAEPPRPRRRTS